MTSKEWEDICISFDEYGMQPATLCNDEEVINNFKKAFYNVLKDLEILEILKSSLMLIENKQMTFGYGKYHLAIRPDVILNDETIQIIKEWLNNDK